MGLVLSKVVRKTLIDRLKLLGNIETLYLHLYECLFQKSKVRFDLLFSELHSIWIMWKKNVEKNLIQLMDFTAITIILIEFYFSFHFCSFSGNHKIISLWIRIYPDSTRIGSPPFYQRFLDGKFPYQAFLSFLILSRYKNAMWPHLCKSAFFTLVILTWLLSRIFSVQDNG